MKLVILRHGQTFGNVYSHFNTWEADRFNYLTPRGVQQASECKLPDLEFKRFFISQFNRSRQTMMCVLLAHKLVIHEQNRFFIEVPNINEWSAGETQQQVVQRILNFLVHLRDTEKEGNVLAVGHGIYMQILFELLKMPLQQVDHEGQFPHCVPIEIDSELVTKTLDTLKKVEIE